MGGGGGTQQTVTKQKLSSQQKALLNSVVPVAQSYFNPDGSVKTQPFQGSTVAPITPEQVQGQQMALGAAMQQQGVGEAAAKGSEFLTSGAALDPSSNPYLSAAINAAIRPITENYTQTVLGGIRDNAQLAGQYGYNRQAIEDTLANQAYLKQVGDTSGTMSEAAYQAGLDAMSRSLAFAPGVQGMATAPASTVAAVGQNKQDLAQQQLDAKVREYYQSQFLPLSVAEEVAQIAFGIPAGSVSSTTSGGSTSTLQSILGLGSAGLGLAGALGKAAPGIGTGVSSLLGLLAL